MSRWMQMGLCLALAAVSPLAAQYDQRSEKQRIEAERINNERIAKYFQSSVVAAEWPDAVMCGDSFTVDVTMINPGNAQWAEQDFHKLGPIKGEEEAFRTDGYKFKMPEGAQVGFRGQHTFTLELEAPEEAGKYETHWSMMRKGIPYGAALQQEIKVYCDHAEFGTGEFPKRVSCGEAFTIPVSMKNAGKSTWTEAKFYKLGPVLKTDEVFRPDGHKFKMPDGTEVPAGNDYSFDLELVAPETEGTYETKWTMMKHGRPFGEEITRKIKVRCKGEDSRKLEMRKVTRD